MASQTEDVTAGQSPTTNQQSQITNQKPPIPRKSTGPRTAGGKRRSSQNARKHGLYSNANFFWDAAIALGEDPRDFERLLKGLVLARQPADTLEMVLVEDIALLVWKKARLDRAEAAVQVCNLQKHDLERRKQFVQVGRDISDTLQSEVREKGLRTRLDAPGKFEQILSILDILVEMVEKNDFSPNMQEFLRGVYGEEPTLRGAGLYNNYFKLSEMQTGSQEFEDAKTLMRARLAEEISDVAQQYELFLHEHVENTRAARMAATAPSHAQWAAIIRQQNALHRQLQQKIRLLAEIQEKRKREEERFLDNCEASLRRDPSDAPRGGRHGANLTRSAAPASPGPACQPRACGVGYPQNETPRGGRQASDRKKILNRGNEPKDLLKTQDLAFFGVKNEPKTNSILSAKSVDLNEKVGFRWHVSRGRRLERTLSLSGGSVACGGSTPSPGPCRLVKAPARSTLSPKGERVAIRRRTKNRSTNVETPDPLRQGGEGSLDYGGESYPFWLLTSDFWLLNSGFWLLAYQLTATASISTSISGSTNRETSINEVAGWTLPKDSACALATSSQSSILVT